MKKIPTLFKREYADHKVVGVHDEITPGCKEAFLYGVATVKWDGTCCAVISGQLYRRYDAKKGKNPPKGAIPCCSPDPVTGHWPHWVKVDENDPNDKWHVEAWKRVGGKLRDGTYELIGKHFQGNPYSWNTDFFMRHGEIIIPDCPRTFEDIRNYLEHEQLEGIVFWLNNSPVCKIKRSDFGLQWPIKTREA